MLIISAERPEFSTTHNAVRSSALLMNLLNIVGWDGVIIPCEGSWMGVEEQCYAVHLHDMGSQKSVELAIKCRDLSLEFDQECVGYIISDAGPRNRMATYAKDGEDWKCTSAHELVISADLPPGVQDWINIKDMFYYPGDVWED